MPERRHFSRVVYQAAAVLTQQQQQWQTEVRDLSLQGVLLAKPENWSITEDNDYTLEFTLPQSEVTIEMQAHLVLFCEHYLRLRIHHIDLDSASHLKRLVELNVGNEDLLHRELDQLSDLIHHD
ncbi:PilZ domain-containing protein [Vibrio sp. Of7-15]|uniref:PilZ domain-containing protein n=1 Tax=Vibrio sp. Of7-15 TaxID=2724879 RepID=UPI001EF35CEE|nr:PilZ domain-containing protein [Vibrio sp. Of7-15]MCG7499849.1 PilZ domain-containing protein [Vibrio sp. Of7-15]